jgi:hypothetical protein
MNQFEKEAEFSHGYLWTINCEKVGSVIFLLLYR